MSDAVYVDTAAQWARQLTQSEIRGPGDMPNAWRRLEARYGVPATAFWALRYRKPRQIAASLFHGLSNAYQAECKRQMSRLRHEIEIAKQIAGPDCDPARAAESLLTDKS